jgi:uncharacterized membrane protein
MPASNQNRLWNVAGLIYLGLAAIGITTALVAMWREGESLAALAVYGFGLVMLAWVLAIAVLSVLSVFELMLLSIARGVAKAMQRKKASTNE